MGLAEAAAGVDRVTQQQCYARSSQIIDGLGVRAELGQELAQGWLDH